MKIWPWSDPHAELNPSNPHMFLDIEAPADADVIICAGDLTHADKMYDLTKKLTTILQLPMFYVPGNHDLYRQKTMEGAYREIERVSQASYSENWPHKFVNLHNKVIIAGDVRLIGHTLWTDFMMGLEHLNGSDLERELAYRFQEAPHVLRDYTLTWPEKPPHVLRPKKVLELNRQGVEFIRQALQKPFEGRTIIVTHHLPTPDCTPEVYRGGPNSKFNYLFANSTLAFGDILESDLAPDLWVCGHTHEAFDIEVGNGNTRIVCNPHGYGHETYNNGFVWDKVIDTDDLFPSPRRSFR